MNAPSDKARPTAAVPAPAAGTASGAAAPGAARRAAATGAARGAAAKGATFDAAPEVAAGTEQSPASDGYFAHHGLWSPGVRLFRQMRFTTQALVISIAIALPLLVLVLAVGLARHDQALSERQAALRQHVQIAQGLLVHAHAQERAGLMSQADAQAMARNALAAMRFGRNETFWISDRQSRLLMHPRLPELVGQDLAQRKGPGEIAPWSAVDAQLQRHGGGGFEYRARWPGQPRAVDAIAQVQAFEPWGWVIGTGLPIDDLQAATHQQQVWTAALIGLVLLLAGYLHVCFRRVTEGGLRQAERYLRAMGQGDLSLSPHPWGHDEAARLMREFARAQDAARGLVLRMRASSQALLSSSDTLAVDTGTGARMAAPVGRFDAPAGRSAAPSAGPSHSPARAPAMARVGAASASRLAPQTADNAPGARPQDRTVGTRHLLPQRMAEVLGLIDAIVVRSHVLSLQAALASVRAGAPGRGLSVLTGDVRLLARSSAESAREIKGLIGLREPAAPSTARPVLPPGATLEDVVEASRQAHQLLLSVTAAAESGNDPSPATQAADRSDPVAAAAAAALREQARTLAREVGRIRLPGDPPEGPLSSRG